MVQQKIQILCSCLIQNLVRYIYITALNKQKWPLPLIHHLSLRTVNPQHRICLIKYLHSNHTYNLSREISSNSINKPKVFRIKKRIADSTRSRLMAQLKVFENQVKDKIQNSRKQTAKIDQKINTLKQGQLAAMQMILGLQRRVKQVQVQLGSSYE